MRRHITRQVHHQAPWCVCGGERALCLLAAVICCVWVTRAMALCVHCVPAMQTCREEARCPMQVSVLAAVAWPLHRGFVVDGEMGWQCS